MQKHEARAIQTDYSDVVDSLISIRKSRTRAFQDDLIELSGGKAAIDVITTNN
jgi:hypothetical protein